MSFEISRKVLEVALQMLPCASSDETRWHISGVYMVKEGKHVVLRATNGHLLIKRCVECAEFPEGKFMLMQSGKRGAQSLLKEIRFEMLPAKLEDGNLILGNPTFGLAVIEKYGSEYPDFKNVIPKKPELTACIAFNAEYILMLAKALTENPKKTPIARIYFDPRQKGSGAFFVEPDGEFSESTVGVCMPIKDPQNHRFSKKLLNELEHAEKYRQTLKRISEQALPLDQMVSLARSEIAQPPVDTL